MINTARFDTYSLNYKCNNARNDSHDVICVSDDSFVVGSSFELLFNIRPRSPTGLLLHVGDSSRMQYGPMMGHYLSVYMLRGEVRLHHTASVHCCWISEFVWSEISTPKFLLHFWKINILCRSGWEKNISLHLLLHQGWIYISVIYISVLTPT